MSSIESAAAAAIALHGHGVLDADLFVGMEEPIGPHVPKAAVFCFQSGGLRGEHYMGCPETYRQVYVEVVVRGEDNMQVQTQARAQAILDSLDRSEFLTGVEGFVRIDALESAPNLVGRNKQKQYIYHVRFQVGHSHTKE